MLALVSGKLFRLASKAGAYPCAVHHSGSWKYLIMSVLPKKSIPICPSLSDEDKKFYNTGTRFEESLSPIRSKMSNLCLLYIKMKYL
jgi:hypothetical protein